MKNELDTIYYILIYCVTPDKMQIKVSDYITQYILSHKINTVFSIAGGFAMHLNDSFGKTPGFDIYYQHHEQACGYSAVGYSSLNGKPSVVCTTSGCAATNAISPCLVAYQDSVSVLFISGQVKSHETVRTLNSKNPINIRNYAGADCDIISMVSHITKYAHEIKSADEVKEIMTKAMVALCNGRPGPVWLSIPIDIQGSLIPDEKIPFQLAPIIQPTILKETTNNDIINIYELLETAKRPLILAGNGIKLAKCRDKFARFIKKHNIPVVTSFYGTDLLESANDLFCGKVGLIGDRAGNFAMQNCDLLISMGCRMTQGIVGYRPDWFAREAKIIYIDNDESELLKENIDYTLKIKMDLEVFFDNYNFIPVDYDDWPKKCLHWKKKWEFELPPKMYDNNLINPYHVLRYFFDVAPANKAILVSSGSIITNVWHMTSVKKNDRFIISSQGDMGFELPTSIGACIADKTRTIIPILGEGSLQLNIQELQTIAHHKLPIKIFVFNNNAYGAIQITQKGFFNAKFGVDSSSGLSFPSVEKIAGAYGIKYVSIRKTDDFESAFGEFLGESNEPIICEVFCCVQPRYPKLSAMKNEDGTFSNRPLEDLEPFLDREEFKKEMIVKIV